LYNNCARIFACPARAKSAAVCEVRTLHDPSRYRILATRNIGFRTLPASRSPLKPRPRLRARVAPEPHWRPATRYTATELAPKLRTWLIDNGSLTERLMSCRRGDFSVQRLYQGWEVPLPSERALLGLPQRQLALVREVALRLGADAVVFARSVFPFSSLTGELAHLRRLENKSLGAILFKHPGMRRRPFELAFMAGDCGYLPPVLHQPTPAWGRRSRFDIAGKPLLVSEVFLESFSPWRTRLPLHRSQRGKTSVSRVANAVSWNAQGTA
jgi:chorismate--pyruvate lyase